MATIPLWKTSVRPPLGKIIIQAVNREAAINKQQSASLGHSIASHSKQQVPPPSIFFLPFLMFSAGFIGLPQFAQDFPLSGVFMVKQADSFPASIYHNLAGLEVLLPKLLNHQAFIQKMAEPTNGNQFAFSSSIIQQHSGRWRIIHSKRRINR